MTPVPERVRPERTRDHGRPVSSLRSMARRETADPAPLSPRVPRRVSGPVARNAAAATAGAALPRGAARPVAPRAVPRRLRLGPLRALPEHRVVDRLLRSRLWIWALGALLGGIVAMQVSLLKLNSGISRAVETTTTLERQNADLEAAIARLSATDRVQSGALQLGMLMPAAGDVGYLGSGSQDPARAVRRMRPPSEDAVALLANDGIVPGSLVPVPAAATTPPPATTTITATEPPAVTPAPVSTPLPAADPLPTTTSQTPATGGAVAGQG